MGHQAGSGRGWADCAVGWGGTGLWLGQRGRLAQASEVCSSSSCSRTSREVDGGADDGREERRRRDTNGARRIRERRRRGGQIRAREVTGVPFLVARRLGSDLVAGPADLRWCGQQQDGEVQARSGKIERAEEGGGARLVGSEGGDGLDWIGGKRGGRLVGSTLITRRVAAAWGLMDGTAPLGFRVRLD